jgi:iron complex outermembrane receptor protein
MNYTKKKSFSLIKNITLKTLGTTALVISSSNIMAVEIEKITVTATKRPQNQQEVPISMSAISGERLKELGIVDARELASNTPGLSWEGTAKSKPDLFLRGVGSSDFQTGSRSPVAFYLDGVYQGSTFGLSSLMMDVDQVEILRGPQGTLWGKNTTAGLLNFTPVKASPGDGTSGYIEGLVGRFGQLKYEGAIGFDITDDLAARVSMSHNEDDGAFTNIGPDFTGDTGGGEAEGYRVNFIYQPNENLSVDFTAHYSSTDGEATPAKLMGTKDPADAANGFRAACPFEDSGQLGTSCVDRDGFVSDPDLHTISQNFRSQEDTESSGLALKVNYEFDNFSLASITAISDGERSLHKDNDSGSSILSEANQDDNFEGWSQEVRFASNSFGDTQWLVGLFYYEDTLDYFRSTLRSSDPSDSSFANNVAAARLQEIDTTAGAIFGEVSQQFTDKFTMTLGLRWTYDERKGYASGFEYNVDPSFPGTEVRVPREYALANISSVNFMNEYRQEDWSEFSGKLAARYVINDDVNLWASIARGFKGGDPNSGAFSKPEDFNFSEPEFLTSYELGIKSFILEGNMKLNASIYQYDYEDKQVFTEIDGGGAVGNLSVLSNAAALTIRGIDTEVTWTPFDGWYIQGALAYIDSEFDDFLQTTRGTTTDRSGNTTALTPKTSFSALIRYDQELSNGGVIYYQVNSVHKDKQYFTNDNDDLVAQGAYWLHSASIGWKNAEDDIEVSLWGKNIGDEDYFVHGFNLSFRGGILNNIGDPMRFGITARYHF